MRTIPVICILILTCCYIACCAEAAPHNRAATRSTQKPPAIDGELNDACWQRHNCARLMHFVTPDMTRLADPQTEALLCFDATNLYVAVRCEEPKPESLNMDHTERDASVWQDDCVELFIDTNLDRDSFYQFVINPKGTVFDRESQAGKSWDADIQVAPGTGDDSWWVECAIPFADLGETPRAGDTWGFNVGRERKVREELSIWAPTYGEFPQPQRFGELLFTDLSAVPALTMSHEPMFGLNQVTISGPQGGS